MKSTEKMAPNWAPRTAGQIEFERLRELARAVWFAEKREKGAALFFLPDATGEPNGEAVALSSVAFREWLGARYVAAYGAAPSSAALLAFVRNCSALSHFPAQVVRRKTRDFPK